MTQDLALKNVLGQPSWTIMSSDVKLSVTRAGGQVAPVVFDRCERKIEPYSVAPWHDEQVSADLPRLLKVLRGDFFCMPFGIDEKPYRGEQHPLHGETANQSWSFVSHDKTRLVKVFRRTLSPIPLMSCSSPGFYI